MPFPWVAAAMAAAGLVKGMEDEKKAKHNQEAARVATQWAPWTGIQPRTPKEADIMGSVMQGGMAGMGMQQSMDNSNAYQDMLKRQQVNPNTNMGTFNPYGAPGAGYRNV